MAIDWRRVFTQEYVWFPAGVVGLLYVGAPLLIRQTMPFNTRARVEALMPEQLPPPAWEYFGMTAPGLAECGFAVSAYASISGMIPNSLTYFALWLNESAGQWAMATWMNPGNKRYVEFMTIFADASSVLTNNSGDIGVFKRHPSKDAAGAPWLTDPRELYQLHVYRETLARPRDPTRYVPTPQQALGVTLEGFARDLVRQERAGYFGQTSQPGLYRMTIKGAFLMTWKELPPAKQYRKWAAHRRARAQEVEAQRAGMRPPAGARITRVSPYRGGDPLLETA
jgi:hypothetical protein